MENNGWKEFRFSDFVDINPPVSLKANEEYSFVEMKDLEDGSKYCSPKIKRKKGGGAKFQNGDTLFARITPCLENGKICQVKALEDNLGFGSTEFYVFRGKNNVSDTEFVYYLSRWDSVRAHAEINLDGTSGRQRVPKASFDDLVINMPPIPEQKAIANVLSSLDDKIDLLHQQNQTLEALAETLFRQWFIEEAKEDWEEVKIVDLFEVRDGTHDSPKQKEFGKKLITSKHILKYSIDFESAYNISEDDYININKRSKVEFGDILFSMIGTIGNIYIEQSIKVDYAIKNIGLFKTSQNLKWKYFTFLWLKSNIGKDFIFENRSGSTQEYISLGSLRNIHFKMPNRSIVDSFNERVDSIFQKLNVNQKQIQTLTQLRDTLLPKLMSGEVRVQG